MGIQYLDDKNPDGTCLVRSGEKLGFYGTAPIVQPSSGNQAAFATGFTTTLPTNTVLQASVVAAQTLLNQLRTDLVNLGLIKGSA